MNALNEPEVMRALYEASQAGVEIDLIVRGACALRPGIPGVSDNIRVRSIVGRFLEHSRVYWFGNDGAPELFCCQRRLAGAQPAAAGGDRASRCSTPASRARVQREGLLNYLADNQNAWELRADGRYERRLPAPGEEPFSAQLALLAALDA